VEEGYDAVLEDNVRVRADAPALLAQLPAVPPGEAEADGKWLRYYGYLGREEDMEAAHAAQSERSEADGAGAGAGAGAGPRARWAEWPVFTETRSGRTADLFWGAYAYSISPPAATAFLATLRSHWRTMLFRQRRRGAIKATPIDRAMPFCMRGADERLPGAARAACCSRLSICSPPLFFRAPMLPSELHTKWDRRFFDTTTAQLRLHGVDWGAVWLLPEERERVARLLQEPAAASCPPPE